MKKKLDRYDEMFLFVSCFLIAYIVGKLFPLY